MQKRYTIGIVGGFDVENYGDILFPIVAEHELRTRLPAVRLLAFSYRAKKRSEWPHEILPLDSLPNYLEELDGLIIGGGHLIHFNENMADGYVPPQQYMDHPTSFWLAPALLSGAKAMPLMWNAVSSSYNLPNWSKNLVGAALKLSDYVGVRDEHTKQELLTFANNVTITVVPDSVFGIVNLIDKNQPSRKYQEWLKKNIIAKPYIIVQSSEQLRHVSASINDLIDKIHQDYMVVEVPISPILGDKPGLLDIDSDVVAAILPDTLLLAEIVAHSSAVITQSLHLSITAISYDVPVIRTANFNTKTKYDFLAKFKGVFFVLGEMSVKSIIKIITSNHSNDMKEVRKLLNNHWDAIVSCIKFADNQNYVSRKNQKFSEWIFALPKSFKNNLHNFPLAQKVNCDTDSYAYINYINGFASVEHDHIWTTGQEARMQIAVKPMLSDANVTIEFSAFINKPDCASQICEIYVNDRKTNTIKVTNSDLTKIVVPLKFKQLPNELVTLRFVLPDAKSPASLGINSDTRQLGLALYSLRLEKKS